MNNLSINKVSFFKIFAIFISVLLLVGCVALSACSSPAKNVKKDPETVKYIGMGPNLPQIKSEYVGIGDIVIDDELKQKATDTLNEKNSPYVCQAAYSAVDNSGNITVCYWKDGGSSLSEYKELASQYQNFKDYRIAESEIYLYDGKSIQDLYYVYSAQIDDVNYIFQSCNYLDGNDIYTLSIAYKCVAYDIPDTNISIDIPDNFAGRESVKVNNNEIHVIYYDELTELPSITYGVTQKQAGQTIDNIAAGYKSNFNVDSFTDSAVNGIPCKKGHIVEYYSPDYQLSINGNIYLFDIDDKVISVTVSERSTAKTYALDAFENNFHYTN